MDENKFWLRLWQSIMASALLGIMLASSCTIHSDRMISKEIIHGVDPILAMCAHSSSRDPALCAGVQRK